MIKVFLVEDHEIVREGLKALLREEPEISVVGEAANGKELIEKLATVPAIDLVILDVNMPIMDGLETTRYLMDSFKGIKILVLSMMENESFVLDLFDAGACAYLLKNGSKEELVYAIKKVARSGIYVSPELAISVINRLKDTSVRISPPPIDLSLSKREMEILELISDGLTNAEIADKVFASRRTVETYRKKLIEKTKCKNTAALIKYAIVNGILK